MALTGKTIGQLTYLSEVTTDTLFPVELSGDTYHISYSAFTNSNYNEGTYNDLYSFATGGTLTAGSYYLMTDYQACYDQPNFDNYKDPITTGNYKTGTTEPILLLAISTTGFSPTVYSTLYPNDKITYDITWNTTEITSSPAKGRITERIDNFNNRTDYDNRSILFKRYNGYSYYENLPLSGLVGISGLTGTTAVLYGNTGTTFTSNFSTGDIVSVRNLDPSFFEVISVVSNSLAIISGVTIGVTTNSPYYPGNDDGVMSYYQPNVRQNQVYEYTTFGGVNLDGGAVNNYIGNYSNLYDWDGNTFILANNVFISGEFFNNTIGNNSYNNTFNDDCDNNQIGDSFYNNSTNDDFDGNIIGENFNNNYITSNFNNNRIGSDFNDNTLLGGSFYRNNIGNDFNSNVWTDGNFQNNEIGNQFNNNNIYNDFYNNDIGNGYNGNESYSEFYRNLIGNGYNYNTVYSYFYENNIGHGFYNNTIGTNLTIGTFNFRGNIINNIFENNTILDSFLDNTIGNEFKGNLMLGDFELNDIGSFVGGNQFSGGTYNNKFGSYTFDNDFLGNVFANSCMVGFNNNTIGENFSSNNIGFNFGSNVIGENFGNGGGNPQGNVIGNYFYNNTVGEYFYNNTIADNFQYNEVGNYFQWNIINTNIDYTDFTINYGNITGFSYTAAGTGATDTIYTDLTGTTNGHGVNATFDVEVSGGTVIGVTGATEGRLYQNDDELTILGTQIGGTTPEDDIVITVTGTTSGSSFYQHYTKQIFERRLGNKRVSFYDEDDILNVDSVYEISGYITVYSQSLLFPFNNASFEFWCDGSYTNNGGYTSQTTNNTQELVTLFNNNFRQFGYFFDNNDGTIGLYINPSLKQQYCPSGTYTINVFND